MEQDRTYGKFIENIRTVGAGFSDVEYHLPDSTLKATVHRHNGFLAGILVPVSAAAVFCLCIFLSCMRPGSDRVSDTETAVMISRSVSGRPASHEEFARTVMSHYERRKAVKSMENLN